MMQNFKMTCFLLLFQPGTALFFAAGVFLTIALLTGSVGACLLSLALASFQLCWQRKTYKPVGENFRALRSIPFIDGKRHYMLVQTAQKGAKQMSCRALLLSLLRDKRQIGALLPVGTFVTVTHEGGVRALRHAERVTFICEPTPLCQCSMRPVLRQETAGRCHQCKFRCSAWNAAPRTFFLVRFSVAATERHDMG